MKKCFFFTEAIYVDKSAPEGGVRMCTLDFLKLLEEQYEVNIIKLAFRKDFLFKVKSRLGIDTYDYYSERKFNEILNGLEVDDNTFFAFNMTQTLNLTKVAKNRFGDRIKIIMLSHGNETGDFVHTYTRFFTEQPIIKRFTSSYKLGSLLKKEAYYKRNYIDLVLNVSEIEDSIEKWLNAPKSYFIPRTVIPNFLVMQPTLGRVGFLGDLSHYPNYFAVDAICNILNQKNIKVDFRLIGKGGEKLKAKYKFINYLDFLEDEALENELKTWSSFLNIAFYYSRGVSTKLGKALSLGLPIISTEIGVRGYQWDQGKILIGNTPEQVCELIENNVFVEEKIKHAIEQTHLISASTPSYAQIMKKLKVIIDSL